MAASQILGQIFSASASDVPVCCSDSMDSEMLWIPCAEIASLLVCISVTN